MCVLLYLLELPVVKVKYKEGGGEEDAGECATGNDVERTGCDRPGKNH